MNPTESPPRALTPPPDKGFVELTPAEALILRGDALEGAPWLAGEFLLWLWYRSERDFSTFDLGDKGQVDLWIDDRLVFLTPDEQKVTSTFRGGAPSTLPEAKLSILSGKRIVEATVGMRRGEHEWRFMVRATGGELLLSGVKIPAVVKQGGEEMVYERMYLLDAVEDTLGTLFARFFDVRTSSRWREDEWPALNRWLLGGE